MSNVMKLMGIIIIVMFCSNETLACGGHLRVQINAGNLSGVEKASIGDTLYKKEGTLSSFAGKNIDLVCEHGANTSTEVSRLFSLGRMNGHSAGNGIYATNLDGVGIRITVAAQFQSNRQWRELPYIITDRLNSSVSAKDIFLRVELLKTNEGASADLMHYYNKNALIFKFGNNSPPTTVDIDIIAKRAMGTCHIMSDSVDINLGNTPLNQLKSTSGNIHKLHDFKLPVRCNNVHEVFMTLKGVPFEGRGDVLALINKNNVAGGVGIQLIYNKAPLYFGTPVDISKLFTNGDTQYIPFSVAYYVTKSIVPGVIESVATLNLDYI